MLKGFRDFVLRGNVIDLAVAVVIGAAFGTIVTALVDNIINPLIAAIVGKPDITQVGNFAINGANFSIGAVLQAILNFLFVAAAVYFVLVAPMNKLAVDAQAGRGGRARGTVRGGSDPHADPRPARRRRHHRGRAAQRRRPRRHPARGAAPLTVHRARSGESPDLARASADGSRVRACSTT